MDARQINDYSAVLYLNARHSETGEHVKVTEMCSANESIYKLNGESLRRATDGSLISESGAVYQLI